MWSTEDRILWHICCVVWDEAGELNSEQQKMGRIAITPTAFPGPVWSVVSQSVPSGVSGWNNVRKLGAGG